MHFTLLGTGGAWPDAERSSPAFLFEHDDRRILIDCGGGTCRQLMRAGTPPSTLTDILLTHTHIDHCVEFPSLVFGAYLTGKTGEFRARGAKGTAHYCTSIFRDAFDFAPPMMKKLRKLDIDIDAKDVEDHETLTIGDVKVECASMDHGFPAMGFRFSVGGKTIVHSGDTQPCQAITELARGADVLIMECSFPETMGPRPFHCIPSQVGRIAQEADVGRVVLVHLFPPCNGKEKEMIEDVRKQYRGPVEVGQDLQVIQC
ncbi:MAG: ribonuclease Z [Candidatus Peribacteraceae bacterium]|nr:ribonuclease Z [Candidatus Peribacteraceae bacterium]